VNGFLGQVPIRTVRLGQNDPFIWSIERAIAHKRRECYLRRLNFDSLVGKYYQEDTAAEFYDEILEPSRLELNVCIDELKELIDTANYGPRLPAMMVRGRRFSWPVQEPEQPEQTEPLEPPRSEPEAPATAAPTPWQSEVPAHTTTPISEPEPEPAEPIFCDPINGLFLDPSTGQCRSSVGPGFTSPFLTIGPSVTSATPSFMSGGRIQTAPLHVRRF
jgi:hypothetical protein